MYLRKLEMRGFKTFADKTEMVFNPGITAIVGPNGSGKSNVTDAILWCLGEQSPRALRTEALQDVIFAGADGRRPLNMAEVSVTLENSDRSLATDYAEVVLTRRLFRNGDSEYLINNSTCRLRDVRELLLDTGVGPKAYSVVGQGEIDAVLSIRSEDRRELLEEVAGVRKYRVRRTEAERKLDATQVNLTRVADIIHELRSQREPLEREADAARIYKELDEKLKTYELHLLSVDYRRHAQKRGQLVNEVAVARADLQATRNQVVALEAEQQRLRLAISQLEQQLENARREALLLQRAAAEAREKRAVNQERLRSLQARHASLAEALEVHRQRETAAAAQLAAQEQERDALQARVTNEEQLFKNQSAEYEARRQAAEKRRRQAEELAARRVRLLQEAARLENEAAALAGLQADLLERIGRMDGQGSQLHERLQGIDLAVSEGEEHIAQIAAQAARAREARTEAHADVERAQQALQDQAQKRAILSDGLGRLESRHRVLEELRSSYEGYSEGTRTVMTAATEGRLGGIRGVVGEMLDVPQKLETAVQAALEDRLQWIVVNTHDDARRAIEYLHETSGGRAAFYPLSAATRDSREPAPTSGLRGSCLGVASRLVRYDRAIAPVMEALLGQILICEDLEGALDIHRRFGGRYTVATLDGDVLEPVGAMRGGAIEGGATQGFSRQRELDALQGAITSWRQSLEAMWQTDEQLENYLNRCRRVAEEAAAACVELQSEAGRSESDLKHLRDQQKAAREAQEELATEVGQLRERLGQSSRRQAEAEAECEAVRAEIAQVQDELGRADAEAGPGAGLDELRSALTGREVGLAELRERLNTAREACDRLAREARQAAETHVRSQQELEQLAAEMQDINRQLEQTDPAAEDGVARAAVLEQEAEQKAEGLAGLRERDAEAETRRRELSAAQESQAERLHRAELALARTESQIEITKERLAETYGVDPEETPETDVPKMSENDIRRETTRLRGEMRRLGPVNLSSIDECERLKAREEYLSSQQADLESARDDLLSVIEELDQAAQEAFLETFEKVKIAFDELFRRLFDGGSTELRLTCPEDPLCSGVEVVVTTPGKRQQNLLMLSGGERALTALAFLFAMLKVKPSPFCVMDEIDAALDASNTDRFGEMLREFAARSQFILITHNPRNMEKVDVLYGVTMQEPGCSKIISVELEDAKKAAEDENAVTADEKNYGPFMAE